VYKDIGSTVSQSVAVQCGVVWCSVVQCCASGTMCSILPYATVCCRVMQCEAVLHESRGAPGEVDMDLKSASGLKGKASYCPIVQASKEHLHACTHMFLVGSGLT